MKVRTNENRVLVNLYGDDETYKPYPDIGEKIRDDGLVLASHRRTDSPNGQIPVNPDMINDILYYARPGAVMTEVPVFFQD